MVFLPDRVPCQIALRRLVVKNGRDEYVVPKTTITAHAKINRKDVIV